MVPILVACGCIGIFCSPTQEAQAEEPLTALPLDMPLTEGFAPISASVPEPIFSTGQDTFFSVEERVFPEEVTFPTGKEVTVQRLQGKFLVGKRAAGIIYHPGATLSFRTGRGLGNYMGWEKGRTNPLYLTEEEKIARGFQFAEQVTESVQALPIPFIGNFIAECLHIGRDIENANKKFKKKYRLHLNYSEKTFRAAYKESF